MKTCHIEMCNLEDISRDCYQYLHSLFLLGIKERVIKEHVSFVEELIYNKSFPDLYLFS